MSAEEHDEWKLECPECGNTGTAQINTPQHGYAVMRGDDRPYVKRCPDGFEQKRGASRITFTCVDCGDVAKVKS